MKTPLHQKILVSGIFSFLVFFLTGCPSSPDGSKTGTGHPPSATTSSDTNRMAPGEGNPLNDSSNDTNKTGTGHPPSLSGKDSVNRAKDRIGPITNSSNDTNRVGPIHRPSVNKKTLDTLKRRPPRAEQ